jgi:hypothetical protein
MIRPDDTALLSTSPLDMPADWVGWVNGAQTAAEIEALRNCVNRGTPYGSEGKRHGVAS